MTSWDIKLKGRIKKYIEICINMTDHWKKIELSKSFLTPWFLLLRGQCDQAMSDLTKALEINPRLADAYFNRGDVYLTKGQHNQAISDFNKVLEINPLPCST